MLTVLGENYFIDLDQIENYLDTKEEIHAESGTSELKVNVIKFEMVKMLLEVLLTENTENDEKLGLKSKDLSVPFKIAFNTLINKKLINRY